VDSFDSPACKKIAQGTLQNSRRKRLLQTVTLSHATSVCCSFNHRIL
jgi:hypothetical protein